MAYTHKTGGAEFFAQLKLWKEKKNENEALSYLIELTPPVKITLGS
jgi:hypothetical protein